MAENVLSRLYRNPYAPIDAASVTRIDELGNGLDDWGRIIAPAQQQPQPQSWGELGYGIATAPVRLGYDLFDGINPYHANEHPITQPDASSWRVPPIVQDSWEALNAPGNALMHGMSEDDMRKNANVMAGLAMGGGGLAARPAGGVGMFAGRLAKTADHEALARAEAMATQGADRRAIWDKTGWFQGLDSKWRFEIDDSTSGALPPPQTTLSRKSHSGSITDQVVHVPYFEAYPEAKGLGAQSWPGKLPNGSRGLYANGYGLAYNGLAENPYSIILHELQHDAQFREGFAPGGSSKMFSADDIAAERARVNAPDDRGWGSISQGYGDMPDNIVAHELYRRLAGETEARNVQTRMNMSAAERKATPPWETQDIPDADQIVRMYANGDPRPGIMNALLGYFQKPQAVEAATQQPTFNFAPQEFRDTVFNGGTALRYGLKDDGSAVYISNLETPAAEAGRGQARALMESITRQADKERMPLELDAQRWGDQTDVSRLRDFYRGLGFQDVGHVSGYPGYMRRDPQTLAANASKEAAVPALLDMSPEARMARANEMGFDTNRTLYHGSDKNMQVIQPSHIRSVNAAFDPSKVDSANILAANADAKAALASGVSDRKLTMSRWYHGSSSDFAEFDPSKAGTGAWSRVFSAPPDKPMYFLAGSDGHAANYGTPMEFIYSGNAKHVDAASELEFWLKEMNKGGGQNFSSVQDMIDQYYNGDIYQALDADNYFNQVVMDATKEGYDAAIVDFASYTGDGASGKILIATDPKLLRRVRR